MKWIDQVLELALERKPEALPEKPEVAPVPAGRANAGASRSSTDVAHYEGGAKIAL